ncbi:DUF3137 domain-containing protein [Chitinophaga sp. sic0106]|uniref:DUF3137 domain-containing protein n=1 Tax=Chitinophaga sp. sic0106 TaxID=2854785 RepID=UPI001C4445D8|nr:DUF3137 domain-containing protein [Chitinophaga sp. sic0106]MBV7529669.1 DUF3137 domain-containing protein [Chitinophaga sp. sic0106]
MNSSKLLVLEGLRKKLLLKVLMRVGIWMAVFLPALGWLTWKVIQVYSHEFRITNDGEILLAAIGLLLFAYFLAAIYLSKKIKKIIYKYLYQGGYADMYKAEILVKAIPEMLPGLSYNATQGIPRDDFSQSGFPLFRNPDRYYSSGELTGAIGSTAFSFAEVLAEEYRQDGDSQPTWQDLFRGVFFVVDLQKHTDSNTLVYPDGVKYFAPLLLGKLSQEKLRYQRVKLEDVAFEKYFEVYGTDQTETRYMLSPALMDRMVDFTKQTGKKLQFSFKGSKAYFGIYYPMGKMLFIPPLFSSVNDTRTLETYVAQVRMMTEIIKALNMNAAYVK